MPGIMFNPQQSGGGMEQEEEDPGIDMLSADDIIEEIDLEEPTAEGKE